MILIIGLVGPEILLSQEENRTVVSQSEKKDLTKDIGEQSLDDLKNKRSMVENAGDLGEIEKKNVLQNLDKAIRFREKETQLLAEAKEIAQMVRTAPERIAAIEAELDRPPPKKNPSAPRHRKWNRLNSTIKFEKRSKPFQSRKINQPNSASFSSFLRPGLLSNISSRVRPLSSWGKTNHWSVS
jgi:hypothetical protein